MAEGEWALTSITVWRASADPVVNDVAGFTLDEQLVEAERQLIAIAGAEPMNPVAGLEVRLFCSWCPVEGQHAMTLSAELIRALAAVNGMYWMDVYPPDPDKVP